MKKYLVEFIGTFFLVLAVCLTTSANHGAGAFAPIAIGATLMVMIYAGGYISGAHYNPAVSLAAMIRGKLSASDLIVYWVVQIAGGAVAAIVAARVFGATGSMHPPVHMGGLAAEAIGTFALAYVVLNVATSAKTAGNSNYGLAIGFTVTAMAYTLGWVSGGAFNPAVAVGCVVFGDFAASNLWVYLVGTLTGGAIAGLIYNFLKEPED